MAGMSRRRAGASAERIQKAEQPAALPSARRTGDRIARRFATEAWEVWAGPREAVAVDTVRVGAHAPHTAALRPQKGIPRARGC